MSLRGAERRSNLVNSTTYIEEDCFASLAMTPMSTFYETVKVDELVKSRKTPFFVIPAKAGIQFFQLVTEFLDSGFHRSDDFL